MGFDMTVALVISGLLLPIFWFGLWIPIMVAVARRHSMNRALAIALSILGPVGAAIALVSGQIRDARQGEANP